MTDQEKIEQIMLDKNLSNAQFSSMIGITAGAMSHITNGRTKPTISILRNIKSAFPDINPNWLFYDEGEMYVSTATPEDESSKQSDEASPYSARTSSHTQPDGQGDLFGSIQNSTTKAPFNPASISTPMGRNHPDATSLHKGDGWERVSDIVNIKEIVEQSVAQTVDHLKQKQRKIVEVRVFFDDGTFETFHN